MASLSVAGSVMIHHETNRDTGNFSPIKSGEFLPIVGSVIFANGKVYDVRKGYLSTSIKTVYEIWQRAAPGKKADIYDTKCLLAIKDGYIEDFYDEGELDKLPVSFRGKKVTYVNRLGTNRTFGELEPGMGRAALMIVLMHSRRKGTEDRICLYSTMYSCGFYRKAGFQGMDPEMNRRMDEELERGDSSIEKLTMFILPDQIPKMIYHKVARIELSPHPSEVSAKAKRRSCCGFF